MELLNTIYQSATMGVSGIDDIYYKIKNPKLIKLIKKEKKEYQRIIKSVKKLAENYEEKLCEINMLSKLSSEVISQLKIMKENSDEEIIKMMIEGTYKSLGLLSTKILDCKDDKIKKLASEFIDLLEGNIEELKNI